MNAVPNQPERPEADLADAQDRIQQLEQELEAASVIINEQEVTSSACESSWRQRT